MGNDVLHLPHLGRMCYMERDAVLNIRLKKSLKERIEAEAKIEGISVGSMARRILARHYEGKK